MKPKSRFLVVLMLAGVALLGIGLRVFLAKAECSGGNDIGLVVVVGEAPVPVQFLLASGIDCKLVYPGNVALWTSPLRTTAVASGAVFTSGSGAVFGDANGDGQVRLDDLIFIRNRLGTTDAASDLNDSSTVDENDLVLCRQALGSGPGKVTVYVEGLSPSTALCDVPIQLLTDPDEDGTFTLAETRNSTVVAISISPAVGGLGTPISIAIHPALAPLAFDSRTRAVWRGVYQPSTGSATPTFDVEFSPSEFDESDAGSAVIFVGSGTTKDLPAIEDYPSVGSLDGALLLYVSGIPLRRHFSFSLEGRGAIWETIDYPNSGLSSGPPALGGEPDALPLLQHGYDPDPPADEDLQHSYLFHLAAVLRVPENPATIASAPDHFMVDIVTFDSAGAELDRRHGVRLNRVDDDADPANITYSSHTVRPILLVDVPVDLASYSNVTVLYVGGDGSALILPSE